MKISDNRRADLTDADLTDNAQADIAQPLLSPVQMGAALQLFRLPDVSGLALPDDPSPQDLASLAADLEERLTHAQEVFREITSAIREMRDIARDQVQRAIIAAGARALPHETLEIELVQRTERKRDVATLRTLSANGVPAAELRKAVFIKALDVKGCADEAAIKAVMDSGAKATWECDLRVLDKMARDYGGQIATVIEAATAKVEVGAPSLAIRHREPAMKVLA